MYSSVFADQDSGTVGNSGAAWATQNSPESASKVGVEDGIAT